jgi:hypothetical protein
LLKADLDCWACIAEAGSVETAELTLSVLFFSSLPIRIGLRLCKGTYIDKGNLSEMGHWCLPYAFAHSMSAVTTYKPTPGAPAVNLGFLWCLDFDF